MADELVEWIDPQGVSTPLAVDWSVTGRFAPPVRFEEESTPGRAGVRLRATRHGAREFILPLWLTAADPAALRTRMRDLVASMDPVRGDGRIRVTAPGGDQREITCRVAGGMDLPERLGETSGPTVQRAAVVFRAHDPYWYAASDSTVPFAKDTAASWFPIFPLRLSASEVFADKTIDNPGDVDAWPVWTVIGPGANVVLRNFTTGKVLSLSVALGGETVTIDTRDGAKTVLKPDGTNLFAKLSDTSELWPLARGQNAIRVEMSSAVADTSRVQLTFRPRYLSA